jgi:Tetratricopeptide repeat
LLGGLRAFALSLVVTTGTMAVYAPRPAQADDRDSATVGKITVLNRKAVDAYQHLEFETAVRLLNEALDVSERAGLTLHPIRARTYVTLGIVTLGGFKQRDQAIKYFRKALQIQPEVRLSPGLANPEIQAAFDEAVAGLANGASDELPPEKALVHEPVRSAPAGAALTISVVPDKDLGASAIVLRYRSASAAGFSDLPMQKGPTGAFEATIPASATTGGQIVYFIEARRSDGSVIVKRGTAVDPMVVSLAGTSPSDTAASHAPAAPPPLPPEPKRFYFAILGGTGLGYATGNGEETLNPVVSKGVVWTRTGQLAPEIAYYVMPQLRLGVQARLQLVSGATPYHPLNAAYGECGSDNICSPFKGAFAGLVKGSWEWADPASAFQPYVSVSAGYGRIRHVTKVASPATCGSGSDPCLDTVAGGPGLFGPAIGFQYMVTGAVGLVAELNALIGLPDFTANADLNIGVAFKL